MIGWILTTWQRVWGWLTRVPSLVWDWVTGDTTTRLMISATLVIILVALVVGEVRNRRRR